MKTLISSILMCTLALTQMGCKANSTDALIAALSSISGASAVAIAVAASLEANNAVSSETASEIVAYAQSVSQATATAITELKSSDSTNQKVLSLTAIFSAIPQAALTTSDPKAAAAIQAIQVTLQVLLTQLNAASKTPPSATTRLSPTETQWKELARIQARARQTLRCVASWERTHPLQVAAR